MKATERRVRARRAFAMTAMLTVIGGAVGLRASLTPTPSLAGSSGLAAPVGGGKASAPHDKSLSAQSGKSGGSTSAHQVLIGNAYDVSYGIVQVKVTLNGSRITDITTLSLPQGGRSGDISSFAAPQLRLEALSAQSAKIDTVSGASYTSAGYAQSLQSALDRRGG